MSLIFWDISAAIPGIKRFAISWEGVGAGENSSEC